MRINPAIFHAYDVRGIYPDQIDGTIARLLGGAYAGFIRKKSHVQRPRIIIARDVRPSSEALRQGLIEGLIGVGADCLDLGITTKPQLVFTIGTTKKAEAAIFITASHNDPEYNGFKFYLQGGQEIGLDNGLEEIRHLASGKHSTKKHQIVSLVFEPDEAKRYLARLHWLIPKLEPVRILIDAAGGSASYLLPRLLERYPIFYKPLFFEPDGTFSAHSPNPFTPSVETLMGKEMTHASYQFGISFDGDGDRAIFFDERGRRIRNDVIFALLAMEDLEKRRGSNFVFEISHSRVLTPFLEAYGGKLFVSRIGGIYVTAEMAKRHARLGGELSGHIYYTELSYADSALFTLLKMARLVAGLHRPLSQVIQHLQASSFVQRAIEAHKPKKLLRAVERRYKGQINSRLDGITVQHPDWWFNIRASNTEPLVRLTIEADTSELLKKVEAEIDSVLKSS